MLTILAAISTTAFEILPEDYLPMIEWGGYEGVAVRPSQDHNIAPVDAALIYHSSRKASAIQDVQKGLVKLSVVNISMSADEFTQVKSILKKWDMNVAEFCRYSMTSIAEAHVD